MALRLRGGVEMKVQAIAMTCTRRLVRVGKKTRSARFLFEPCSSVLSLCRSDNIHSFSTTLYSLTPSTRQVMSLTASSVSLGLAGVAVPRLVAGRYAEWRPEMENVLMRAGVARRDYTEENPDWPALVAAVEQWTRAEENASIAYALGRGTASSSSKAGPSAGEIEARRGASDAVARTKKAYALLYQALSDELRRLVAQVPQGYAFGLWNWLEKRFQSTEQDHVGDLWDEFTQLAQEEEESFDVYKSRVDRVYGLLAHAKDKPSPGLYAHRLLWKLSPRYSPAVLALKASGKLKDAGAISWDEIVAFINNHERSEHRLAANEGSDEQKLFAATKRGEGNGPPASKRRDALSRIECFNCGGKGHMARNCRKPQKARPSRQDQMDEGDSEDNERTNKQGTKELASALTVATSSYQLSSADSEDDMSNEERSYEASAQRAHGKDAFEDSGGGERFLRTRQTARRGRPFRSGQY